jgi:dimethylamine/trimethylamine dehydrogenase
MLVVGSGPSGLECALALARRGHEVMLAEADKELGGRVSKEPRLPGLAEWGRVRDYRIMQLQRMSNVEIYPGNSLTAPDVLALDAAHVVLATGASWRKDGIGRNQYEPISGADLGCVYTPDDILAGVVPKGPVMVFDSDHYYMGGAIAEYLRNMGLEVTLVTPASLVSQWTVNTMEQERIQARLLRLGVRLILSHGLVAIGDGDVSLSCSFTGERRQVTAAAVVLVTSREPNDALYQELTARDAELADAGIQGITRIGDCLAPSTIAAAVYAGHRFAREFESPPADGVPFLMERRPIGD